MLASPLPSSFLDRYRLSTPSLGYNALCMVISFLVLWSVCLSSSLVHLRKGPEYLPSGTAQVFIPLIRFLLYSFVSSSSPEIFFFINFLFYLCLFDGVSLQDVQVFVGFLFSSLLILSWFGSSIPSVRCLLPLFITSMVHFSMPYSHPYVLTVYSNCVY